MNHCDNVMGHERMNDLSSPLNFLLSRRSVSPKLLHGPYPNDIELSRIVAAGMRVPDHKGLQPWRIVIMKSKSLQKLSQTMARLATKDLASSATWEKQARIYANAQLVICCIYSPDRDSDLPEWEQFLSAGAVCLSLVNAAIASGFAASWISGGPTEDPTMIPEAKIDPYEQIVGMIHVGSFEKVPSERQRPDMAAKVHILK